MNTAIFHSDVQKFIQESLNSDLTKLVLKGSPFKNVSIQELAQQIEGKQKALQKLRLWHDSKNIFYPKKINLEQTSSEATAIYKSNILSGTSMIDLSGGFGIDSTYFSTSFKQVHHCEINEQLSDIVQHNAKILQTKNLTTHKGNSLDILRKLDRNFDCIYIDPSRRNDKKGKVFLLKDCLPNLPENIDFLFKYSNKILVKNSPILDITSTINELNFVKEIHIVALQNEVKELIFLLEKKYTGDIEIKTVNLLKTTTQTFNFQYGSLKEASYNFPKRYLYEPNAAILKSGAFQEVSFKYKLDKLHLHTHLYTSDKLSEKFPGRIFKIEAILNYDQKKLAAYLPEKKANITVRNFPDSVSNIRKKTKIKDGGNHYLFFTTNKENRKIIIACSKVIC
jgi:hypothetical protein